MEINAQHFERLKFTKIDWDETFGVDPLSWYTWIRNRISSEFPPPETGELLSTKLNRSHLFSLVADERVNTLSCVISILAWGGMNRKHGEKLFSTDFLWLETAEKIRKGELDRKDAYREFELLKSKNKIPGMGPAYFTKLIFFLMPARSNRGYIMDQWTSASVNLLSDKKMVLTYMYKLINKKSKDKYYEIVLNTNTSDNYEKFCVFVELVANKLEIRPDQAEQMMFSKGRGEGAWRNYLIEQR